MALIKGNRKRDNHHKQQLWNLGPIQPQLNLTWLLLLFMLSWAIVVWNLPILRRHPPSSWGSWWLSWRLGLSLLKWILLEDPKKMIILYLTPQVKHCCQEPHHTWRMSSILLRFLIMIIMVGFIFIELDFAWGFQKYIILILLI